MRRPSTVEMIQVSDKPYVHSLVQDEKVTKIPSGCEVSGDGIILKKVGLPAVSHPFEKGKGGALWALSQKRAIKRGTHLLDLKRHQPRVETQPDYSA